MIDDFEDADEMDDTELTESRRSSVPSSMVRVRPENVSLDRRPLSLASTLMASCITATISMVVHLLYPSLTGTESFRLTVKLQVSFPAFFLGQSDLKSDLRAGPTPPDPYVLTPNKMIIILDPIALVYLANRGGQEKIPTVQVFLKFPAICSSDHGQSCQCHHKCRELRMTHLSNP